MDSNNKWTVVNIETNAAPVGQEFDQWTGDISLLQSATSTATSFVMSANAVSLTATYKDIVDAISDNELSLKLYPNPAVNVLIISSNVHMEYVQFFNVNGKLVLEGELNSQLSTIDISQIPSGIYFMNITLEDNTRQIVRFIKQ